MKLILLSISDINKNKCIASFSPVDNAMIINVETDFDPSFLDEGKEYDADVKLTAFIWWSECQKAEWSTAISKRCFPFSFVKSTIEELIEVNLKARHPYVRYKSTINNEMFELTLNYRTQYKDDEPIDDIFKPGDRVVGLFKANIKFR